MRKFVKRSKEKPNTWHSGFKNLDNRHEIKQLSVAMPLLPNQTTPNKINKHKKINNPETKPAIQTGAWFFFYSFFQNFQYQTFGKILQKFREIHLLYSRKIKHFQNVPNFMSKTDKICQEKNAGTHRCIMQSPVHICREWPLEMHCEKTWW